MLKTKHGYHVAMITEMLPTDGLCYVAQAVEWPKCFSQGWSEQEAVEMLEDAIDTWQLLAIGDETGYPLPYAESVSVGAQTSTVMVINCAEPVWPLVD